MSEDDLFAKMMEKVQPIKKENRVRPQKPNRKHDILNHLEEKEIYTMQAQHHARLSVQHISAYELKSDSVSTKDMKKLAQMNIQHELDLHGLTQAQAEQALSQFFNISLTHQARYLSIIHGQGRHSKEGSPVLKDLTYQWLEHGLFSSHILIAIPSRQSRGGACNILLRKQK
ncbi:MAG: Smr/MutS family protein [Ghiorsea sp.]|nr:Smr/MutS family protein [Ghiorsea sp.]